MHLSLHDGDRVCIVGGGPAGSFAAMHLLRMAAKQGLTLDVLIFEPHNPFIARGPRSCKGCAGILSAGTVRSITSLGLTIPPAVVQSELSAYVIHVPGQVATISQPYPDRRIVSVYRGSGPRVHQGEPLASFDNFLLSSACAMGARHVQARVRRVAWDGGPVVHTDAGEYRAALLVLATGVNSQPPLDLAYHYRSPQTSQMIQDEIVRPANWPDQKVAGFFGQPAGLVFGAVVPKGAYLNVSLFWRGPYAEALSTFYRAQAPVLERFLPGGPDSRCGCYPRIVVRPSALYHGDRWVAVGDAAVARLYKDGINSAFHTAETAMRTALVEGISAADFARSYTPFCRRLAVDNRIGEVLFSLSSRALRIPRWAAASLEAVRHETGRPPARQVQSRFLWGMVTGDESYLRLALLLLQPRGVMSFARHALAPGSMSGPMSNEGAP